MIDIGDHLQIDESELEYVTSRSSGPGGQHVNKTETRVTLRFDVQASAALDDEQKEKVFERLSSRIDKKGILRVSSQRHRSQAANRDAATERFADLLDDALTDDPERKTTRIPRRSKKRRLEGKRRRSQIKKGRSGDWRRED